MRSLRRGRGACAGFTSVEVLIGAFLMASLLMVAGMATDRAMGLFRQRRANDQVGSSANRLLQRVASELLFARRDGLVPATMPGGSSTLSFQKSMGVKAGDVEWSSLFTIRWEMEPGELDDGVDNNGNGLVDEGQLVWLEDEGGPDERSVVWAHGLCEFMPGETFDGADEDGDGLVDERGLCFSLDGDVLTIQLGLQGMGPDGRAITRVVETSVSMRNVSE